MTNRGPLGLPRLTNKGPLVQSLNNTKLPYQIRASTMSEEDPRYIPEVIYKQTIWDLNSVTDVGLYDCFFDFGMEASNTGTLGRALTPPAHFQNVDNFIKLDYPLAYHVTADEIPSPKRLLKFIAAHEYCHFIAISNNRLNAIHSLHGADLFYLEELSDVIEYYDFPAEQYQHYKDIQEFSEHIGTFEKNRTNRPEEALCNIVATNYSGVGFERANELKEEYKMVRNDVLERSINGMLDNEVQWSGWKATWIDPVNSLEDVNFIP